MIFAFAGHAIGLSLGSMLILSLRVEIRGRLTKCFIGEV